MSPKPPRLLIRISLHHAAPQRARHDYDLCLQADKHKETGNVMLFLLKLQICISVCLPEERACTASDVGFIKAFFLLNNVELPLMMLRQEVVEPAVIKYIYIYISCFTHT